MAAYQYKLKENLKSMETEDMKITVSVKNGNDDQQDQNDIVEILKVRH